MGVLISAGVPTAMVQNQVYSLPARQCFVVASAAIESSQDKTTWAALTGANTTGVFCGSGFIRCPGGAATVTVKV